MGSLLLLTLNLTTIDPPKYIEDTYSLLSKYFSDTERITIASDNLEAWGQIEMKVPVIFQHLHQNGTNSRPADAIVIDATYDDNLHKIIIPNWRIDTKVLILSGPNILNDIIQKIWSRGLCSIMAAAKDKDGLTTFEYNQVHCNQPPTINTYSPIALTTTIPNIFVKQCYNGRTLNASFMNFSPNVIFVPNKPMRGMEGQIVQNAADKLNLTFNFINRHETEWGTLFPPTGLLGDVMSGRSAIGFGYLVPLLERAINLELISSRLEDGLVYAVPGAAGKKRPTWFIILVSEFSPTTWIAIFLTFCIITCTSIIFNVFEKKKVSSGQWPFYNFAMLLGLPQKIPQPKLVTLACTIGGFLLTAHYQAIMSSKLTAPAKIPEIRTLEELADTKMQVQGPFTLKKLVCDIAKTSSEKKYLKDLALRYAPLIRDTGDVIKQMVQQRDVAIFRHRTNLLFTFSHDKEMTGKVHIVEETALPFNPAILLNKRSCLAKPVQKMFQAYHEGGFPAKWLRDIDGRRPAGNIGPRKLILADIFGFILLLIFGWTASIITFSFEYFYDSIVKFCQKRKNRGKFIKATVPYFKK